MKRNSALYFSVGLVVLLAIVILVFGMFFLNEKDPRETFNTFYLRFTQVSTLVLDDPVKVNGVKMGKVEDISLAGHRVVVRIRLRTDVKIPKDSEIRVQNIGIMGERQIGVILGDAESYWAPGDTINGQFDAGIAEALGLAGEVCDSTKVLLESVKAALNGTIANPEFQDRFRTLLVKAEKLEDRLMTMVNTTDPKLKKSLNDLNEVMGKVDALVEGVKPPIDNLFANTDKTIGHADALVTQLEGVTKHLDELIAKVQSTDNTVGVLLSDRKLHDDLVKTFKQLSI